MDMTPETIKERYDYTLERDGGDLDFQLKVIALDEMYETLVSQVEWMEQKEYWQQGEINAAKIRDIIGHIMDLDKD